MKISHNDKLDFGIILDALLANPEAYVNFGEYWWTLKRMIADWVEENGADVDPHLIRGTPHLHPNSEVDESEVYRFLDEFSGKDDFWDWISYVNPRQVWDQAREEEFFIEDLEWEENFL